MMEIPDFPLGKTDFYVTNILINLHNSIEPVQCVVYCRQMEKRQEESIVFVESNLNTKTNR